MFSGIIYLTCSLLVEVSQDMSFLASRQKIFQL